MEYSEIGSGETGDRTKESSTDYVVQRQKMLIVETSRGMTRVVMSDDRSWLRATAATS